MDLKQESSDPYKGAVKTELDVIFGQTEENDWFSTKQQSIENDHNVLECGDKISEYKATNYFVNVSKIREEIDECVVPKIELQPPDFPEKIQCESIRFVSAASKKEFDVHNVVNINETKQEVSDSEYKQFKTERELLTTHIDLPNLKSESTEYSNHFIQPCSSKYKGKTLKPTVNAITKRKKLYPCLVCQKNLSSSKSRLPHINRHFGKSFVICEFCGKFMTKIDFFQHYFVHLVKNKPIKIFLKNRVSSIHQHLIVYTDEKLFKCDICSKKFKRKSSWQKHLKLIHSERKTFKCDLCPKKFTRKSNLHHHLKIHTDDKPFKCELCCKEFKRKFSLERHLLIHVNETPFNCDICSKQFNYKCNLQRHLRKIHTNETPLKCDKCSKNLIKNLTCTFI